MDIEEKENTVCLISTIIALVLVIIGFFYFTRQFVGISAVICVFIIPLLPFYYLYQHREYIERITFKYEIYDSIQEYVKMLEALSNDIKDYNPEEYEESPIEYLGSVKGEIVSIAKCLEGLIKDDISF